MVPTVKPTPLALTVLALLQFAPSHPYGIQRLIRQWGKDQVVNVEQRAALYRTIARLDDGGLITVRETGRDQQYPERTVYEITDTGRQTAKKWLHQMIAAPVNEYPVFPAALSQLLLFRADEMSEALSERRDAVAAMRDGIEASLAAQRNAGLPRIASLEDEYRRATLCAELDWLEAVIVDLDTGTLTWDAEALTAFAQSQPD